MPAVLEAVDLAALLAEAVAWALLSILVVLLAKLVSILGHQIDLGIVSFRPLGWLADALSSYVLAGAEDARKAVAGAMKDTYDGLVWSFDQMLGLFTDLANATKQLALYLWHHVAKPYVDAAIKIVHTALGNAEAKLETLARTVASDLVKAENYAATKATAAYDDARGFTRTEIATVRTDFTRADAAIDARLDGIGSQAEALAGSIAAAPEAVWGDLKKYADVQNLADATLLGVIGALGIKALTDATGLSTSKCEANQKALCGTDPLKWAGLLEGLLLVGVGFNLRDLADYAETLVADTAKLLDQAA